MPSPLLTRRDILKAAPFLAGSLLISGHSRDESKQVEAPKPKSPNLANSSEKVKQKIPPQKISEPVPDTKIPIANRVMHKINPTLSSSIPAIAVEFREAKVLIAENFKKHKKNPMSSEQALRFDNADAFCRPWAALVVHAGALFARLPANYLAPLINNSPEFKSRFASMVGYYTIAGEVKYIRNPFLGYLRDLVKAELERDPKKYKNDPGKISWGTLFKILWKGRKNLEKESSNNSKLSKQELDLIRISLDLLIFTLSWILGLKLNAGTGKALGGVVGTGYILRDIVAREEAKDSDFDELLKLRDRTRAEMLTWPALFTFNAVLQNAVKLSLPKVFSEDELAQEHLIEIIGNLAQATAYCFGKIPAQAGLEKISELGQHDIWWRPVDWYVKP